MNDDDYIFFFNEICVVKLRVRAEEKEWCTIKRRDDGGGMGSRGKKWIPLVNLNEQVNSR